MMANRNKEKGTRFENQLVKTAKDHGLFAYRVPLSGAGSIKNDVHIRVGREVWEIEAKKRANGFSFIYDNLDGADVLVIGADRKRPIACLDYEDFLDLLSGALSAKI